MLPLNLEIIRIDIIRRTLKNIDTKWDNFEFNSVSSRTEEEIKVKIQELTDLIYTKLQERWDSETRASTTRKFVPNVNFANQRWFIPAETYPEV